MFVTAKYTPTTVNRATTNVFLTWKEKHKHLKVEVKGAPRGRLMFGDRSNDWNVVLGIRRIQQRVEPASPRRDFYTVVKNTASVAPKCPAQF